MNIKFETLVDGHYKDIMKRFDRSLFEALAPPLIPFKILKFTGSQTGDVVHLQFGGLINTEWVSEITDHGSNDSETYFIDEGTKLPFPLSTWKHRHIVKKIEANKSLIIDDINYQAKNGLLTRLIYPMLYAGFKNRGKIYQRFFNHLDKVHHSDTLEEKS